MSLEFSRLRQNESVVWVKLLLLLPTFIFAALTFITHSFRILDWSFQLYAAVSALAAAITIGLWILLVRLYYNSIELKDTGVLIGVLALGLSGAALASIYHLPDSDDYAYVPNAVHYLTAPSDLMGNEIHYLYTGSDPILSVIVGTSQPFEYAQALLAGMLGLEYLTVYHVLSGAAVGFAIPLAVYLLLSHFTADSRNAVLATIVAISVITLLGETKYSFGSLSFTRLFQGKVVLMAAGLPLFGALSIDYLAKPRLRRWLILALAATALSGLSSTAFFMIPMVALPLGLAYAIAIVPSAQGIRNAATYGASLVYPVVYGLYASQTVASFKDIENPLWAGWPNDFRGHLALLLDAPFPTTLVLIIVCLAIIALLAGGRRRSLILVWIALDILFFLNPVAGQFWISNVIGPSIYWRVFLILPIYAIVGMAVIAGLEKTKRRSRKIRATTIAAVMAVLVGLHFLTGSTSIFRRGGQIGLPGYKVSSKALTISRWVISNVPPGTMLAPPNVAGVVGMLTGGYPQLHIGNRPRLEWVEWDQAQAREWASYFARGDSSKEEHFRAVVNDIDDLQVVVLSNDRAKDISEFLAVSGFANHQQLDEFTVYWKQ